MNWNKLKPEILKRENLKNFSVSFWEFRKHLHFSTSPSWHQVCFSNLFTNILTSSSFSFNTFQPNQFIHFIHVSYYNFRYVLSIVSNYIYFDSQPMLLLLCIFVQNSNNKQWKLSYYYIYFISYYYRLSILTSVGFRPLTLISIYYSI